MVTSSDKLKAAPAFEDGDLRKLFQLRLAVARFGEMDVARWWNTKGLLGRLGTIAVKRGFSRSHYFAQARIVFAVARERCHSLFDPPDGLTLWKLPPELEDQLESCWPGWLEESVSWETFFGQIADVAESDLLGFMTRLNLLSASDTDQARKLRRAADGRAVPLPETPRLTVSTLALLAAGFFRGEPSEPAIPYVRVRGE
jgi:hypothetical protein